MEKIICPPEGDTWNRSHQPSAPFGRLTRDPAFPCTTLTTKGYVRVSMGLFVCLSVCVCVRI